MHLVFPGRSLSTEGRRGREAAGWVSIRSSSSSATAAHSSLPSFFQNQVEAADCSGPGAAGRGRELLRAAEDVSVALFLPPKPIGQHGQYYCRGGGRGHVQQHVPDSSSTPSAAAAAAGTQSAHPRPGAWGSAGPQPFVQPHPRHPSSPVKKEGQCRSPPGSHPVPDSCPASPCTRPTETEAVE